MKNLIITLLSLTIYFPAPTFAETITLKSGQEIEGEITEKTEKYIKIDFQGGLTYPLDEIESIKRNLSKRDLEHGRMQVMQMLKDRPKMRTYTDNKGKQKVVTEKDSIWQWTMRKFAGEDLSDTIDWNPESSKSLVVSLDAYHVYPDETGRGFIWISQVYAQDIGRKGEIMSFEDLWTSAVYELINIGSADEFKKLVNEACSGNMSKQELVEKGTKIEFETTQKMKAFIQDVWLPWANKHNFILQQEDGFTQYLYVPDSYSEMIKDDHITQGANFRYWAEVYDQKIIPYLKAVGRYKE